MQNASWRLMQNQQFYHSQQVYHAESNQKVGWSENLTIIFRRFGVKQDIYVEDFIAELVGGSECEILVKILLDHRRNQKLCHPSSSFLTRNVMLVI
jgi:hypothetical protein